MTPTANPFWPQATLSSSASLSRTCLCSTTSFVKKSGRSLLRLHHCVFVAAKVAGEIIALRNRTKGIYTGCSSSDVLCRLPVQDVFQRLGDSISALSYKSLSACPLPVLCFKDRLFASSFYASTTDVVIRCAGVIALLSLSAFVFASLCIVEAL